MTGLGSGLRSRDLLIFAIVDTVLVAGRVVTREGMRVTVDLQALRTRPVESRDRTRPGPACQSPWRRVEFKGR
ncbi:hypothetical protein AB0F77_27780 [Streptomyces sp. NPDC026672]|uniref:hypothetical protein n=1 Tax=Actinomycetes TaxID=1760 RepID=UPI0033E14D9B